MPLIITSNVVISLIDFQEGDLSFNCVPFLGFEKIFFLCIFGSIEGGLLKLKKKTGFKKGRN